MACLCGEIKTYLTVLLVEHIRVWGTKSIQHTDRKWLELERVKRREVLSLLGGLMRRMITRRIK